MIKIVNRKIIFYIRKNWIIILLWIGLGLAVWSIIVYEFHSWGLPFNNIKGWSNCAKGLAYGYICGLIVYSLTVVLPHNNRKKKNRVILLSWMAHTYEEFCGVSNGIPTNSEQKKRIIVVPGEGEISLLYPACFICGLKSISWGKKIKILKTETSILTALIYYTNKINEQCRFILSAYSDILNDREIECLNSIITSQIYAYLNFIQDNSTKPIQECNNMNHNNSNGLNNQSETVESITTSTIIPSNMIKVILDNMIKCIDLLEKK